MMLAEFSVSLTVLHVQLCGHEQSLILQVFVGTESGRVKPHGFYQACKVSSKNSTPCTERDIEGTTVIEIILEPQNEMTAVSVDKPACCISVHL